LFSFYFNFCENDYSLSSSYVPYQKNTLIYIRIYFHLFEKNVLSVDFTDNPDASTNVLLNRTDDLETSGSKVEKAVGDALLGNTLDGIVNAAGGWAGGNISNGGKERKKEKKRNHFF